MSALIRYRRFRREGRFVFAESSPFSSASPAPATSSCPSRGSTPHRSEERFPLHQEFRELPTLRLALEGHLCLTSPTSLRLCGSLAAPPPNRGHVLCSQSTLDPLGVCHV